MLIIIATGASRLVAAVTTVGLDLSSGASGGPDPAVIGLLEAGAVGLIIRLVANFEHQSRLWPTR